jgi:hypothetical protein
MQVTCVAANAFCNILGVYNWPQAGSRAAIFSVINLLPLLLAGQLSLAADLIGIILRSYIRIHGIVGYMVFAQTLARILIVVKTTAIVFKDNLHFYGLLIRLLSDPQYICMLI